MGRDICRKAADTVIKGNQVVLASVREISDQVRYGDQPTIRLHENNGVIERIEIVCTCGREIEIYCDYGDKE